MMTTCPNSAYGDIASPPYIYFSLRGAQSLSSFLVKTIKSCWTHMIGSVLWSWKDKTQRQDRQAKKGTIPEVKRVKE